MDNSAALLPLRKQPECWHSRFPSNAYLWAQGPPRASYFYVPVYLSIYLPIYLLCICLSSVSLSINLPVYLPVICLSISACLSSVIYPASYLSILAFWERVLCTLGWPQTHSVAKNDLTILLHFCLIISCVYACASRHSHGTVCVEARGQFWGSRLSPPTPCALGLNSGCQIW